MDESNWPYFPVFLQLQDQPVLLVGGGEVAARKLLLLRRAGARVQIVAAALHGDVQAAVADGAAEQLATAFDSQQLRRQRLIVAATDDRELNARVAAAAAAANIPVNVVDDPALSTFIVPAIVDRSPLMVAVSSGGAAPVLARRLRERIETMLPAAYGGLARFMHRMRAAVKAGGAASPRRVWEAFLDGGGAEAVLRGDEAAAERTINELIAQTPAAGEVYLVGAGPGDPDLLTFRALRLMQQCDVVLYDRLVSPGVMELVRRDAERIFVGKARNQHTVPQDQINLELVRQAQAGRRVLRLKGGDPFIFGRGGEEIETLMAHGVAFQVVPGVTAAAGCAAYAGIPLTHRDYAQSCIFVTGHARKDGVLELHWDQLARRGQTVVFYMGLQTLAQICAQLLAHGLPPDWPAAVVEEGTSPRQRVVTGTLGDLADRVQALDVKGPSLLMVGEVVKLREKLAWFSGAHTTE
ncbi:siroheme synthase CysG [Solimonas marina]|uniref:Siroheme synthase n=1 Tax=Solimonas marina TaxID=2714601 RepID=A0A969W9R9_9GAMM|nr:siroheme synthase CysG [Solimonas marina]NKF23267.1 uroporphyrinogen-III C-methyltransferase [Solimonas marina]